MSISPTRRDTGLTAQKYKWRAFLRKEETRVYHDKTVARQITAVKLL